MWKQNKEWEEKWRCLKKRKNKFRYTQFINLVLIHLRVMNVGYA